MDIRQLRYFLAVAEQRHFTRAAEQCFVSQPALSQQVLSLERELGAPLFDRLSTGAELTTAGRALLGHAQRILLEVENARVAVNDVAGTVRGELSVAAVHTASLALVVDAVAAFRQQHPAVSVRIIEERSSAVLDAVVTGRVNLGVTYLPTSHAGVVETPLYPEELVLVVPEGHALTARSRAVGELAGVSLIVPPEGWCLRAGIEDVLARAGAGMSITAEISAVESMCAAVRAGLGVTLLPRAFAERPNVLNGLRAVRLKDPVPVRAVGAIRRSNRHMCLATKAFVQALLDGATSLRTA